MMSASERNAQLIEALNDDLYIYTYKNKLFLWWSVKDEFKSLSQRKEAALEQAVAEVIVVS